MPSSSENFQQGSNTKKTVHELEKTLCVLKRIIEKLQSENKRLKSKNSHRLTQQVYDIKIYFQVLSSFFLNIY